MDNPSEQNYLSSKDAGSILGYTHDYISRLCRHGKMSGIQKGREWYVTKEELEAFKGRHEIELQEKKKELSKKFSQIRKNAEAKKRQAREEAIQNPQATQAYFAATKASDAFDTENKLTFKIPKQLVAIAVLAFVLLIPSLFQISSNVSIKDFNSIVGGGIQETIYSQSTVVEPVAAIFSFTPHLAQGYREFFNTIGQLPKETFSSMEKIGNGYLVLYLLQGQALYETLQSLNTMGAIVLRGYELIGESFWFGGKDILEKSSDIISSNTILETTLKYPRAYVSNVAGGFEYMKEDIDQNVFNEGINSLSRVMSSLQRNIGLNFSAITNTASAVSSSVGAHVGSLFEFNLIEKEAKIKAIRLQQ